MHNTGYLATKSQHPAALAGSIAIHVVGLTALLLIAPQVTKLIKPNDPIKLIPLPKDPIVVPPEKPQPKAAKPDDHVTPTKPIFETKPDNGNVTRDPGPIDGAGSGEGLGGGEITFPPLDPPKDPVIVGPQFSGRNAQPPYPPGLQRLEIEGAVTVRVLVGVDGRPLRIEVVRTDNEGFFTATRDWAMRHWQFKPATRDGVPFQEWRVMTVRFSMIR